VRTIGELIHGLAVDARGVDPDLRIDDVTEDSRAVTPGSLFVARPGRVADGRRFIADALSRGAAAVLTDAEGASGPGPVLAAKDVLRAAAHVAERFFGEPSRRLTLIGVTGTNGKTTVAHLTQQLLDAAGIGCGLIGTIWIDDGGARTPATLTTPSSIDLSRTLARMVQNGRRAVAMEVSSHALVQGRAAALDFDIGVFTNLSGEHLDEHGDMDGYAAAKAMLFEALPSAGLAILNADDEASKRMARDCAARRLWCAGGGGGQAAPAGAERASAAIRSLSPGGASLRLGGPWGAFDVVSRLPGAHNAMNLLQAVAAAHAAGASMTSLREAVPSLTPPPGRLEPVRIVQDQDFAVLVDYAHTDDALRSALLATRGLLPAGGRLVLVFGCGGDRDAAKRPRMGAVASELADESIITSDNPRTEEPGRIAAEVLAGVPEATRERTHVEVDRAAAIELAVRRARSGDIVLIAGKGHEDYQILPDGRGGTVRRDFDDRVAAREALGRRFGARAGAGASS